MKLFLLSSIFLVALHSLTVHPVHGYKNVYGKKLESCSSSGMALTGYTRTGYCVDQNDDSGSHHICIDLSSTTGGNFCTTTGQSDWCSSNDMPCHDDSDGGSKRDCSIEDWCVCQWAFASYIRNAGGCDYIQELKCEAINVVALDAYRRMGEKYSEALECLEKRCSLTSSS